MNAKLIMTVAEMQDRDKWLQSRMAGIGGSDAAVVVGLNRWKSSFQLWMEKVGQVEPEDLSENEYVYWGTVLEEVVAKRFCELTDKKVQRRGLLQHEDYPFILASVDRMVVGENAGLECKTCNGFAGKEWEDDNLPDSYYVQCQHYMLVTGCEKWYIAVLIGGNHFIWKTVERNEEDIKLLLDAEIKFWDMVQSKTMPSVDSTDNCSKALASHFSGGMTEPVSLPSDAVSIIENIKNLEDAKKETENSITYRKNQLREMMGDNEIGYASDYKVSWKTQNGRTTLDSKNLKKNYPDIYAQYSKVGNPTRVLRIS
ncbi:YqaJ viral recombinase family protein [Pectinatus frisingensis]|uniref:YqaJ viral recombinase family nuclease n=1 Tax=Pectinatus frisingensis TaxID=865 RepID=UPI001E617AA4|nr:YqaJ viral recombinase family protein [Pectinatus frisingensis]